MSENSNNSSKTIGVIVVILIVLVVGAGIWYFGFYTPEQEAKEKARLEQIARAEAEKKRQEEAAQRKARYDQLIIDADAAFEQEDWVTAQSRYSDASTVLPNEQYPKDQLVLVNAKLDEIAAREARRAAGVVETVSSPTGRFFVIVSSSIDDDLAMDYAKKLAQEGTSVKLVQHNFNDLPFHGVSVGDYTTWQQAEAALPSYSNYGNVWVLKY